MSVKKFKFVSPGVFINEIDNSFIPTRPDVVGPTVIGRATQGLAMQPIKVEAYSDFLSMFGDTVPGAAGGDVYRDGANTQSPIYGTYASKAFLNAGVAPLTYVRTLGLQHPAADTATSPFYTSNAGWRTEGLLGGSGLGGGAFGLFVMPSASIQSTASVGATPHITGNLAAVWYLESGLMMLSGTSIGSGSAADRRDFKGCGTVVESDESGIFKAVLLNGSTGAEESFDFSLDDTNKKYIRKVFNTNPQLYVSGNFYPTATEKTHWLGETYDQETRENLSGSFNTTLVGVVVPLHLSGATSQSPANRLGANCQAREAVSGWFIGQDTGDASGFNVVSKTQKLFRFIGRGHGAWLSENVKISIDNIRQSNNSTTDYGTFSVLIRLMSDNDNAIQLLERFDECTLDPTSPNYIARKIGDQYSSWSENERRLKYYGEYPNQSKYIYVEVNADVAAGASGMETLLPFGYYGPPKYSDIPAAVVVSGSATLGAAKGVPPTSATPAANVGSKYFQIVTASNTTQLGVGTSFALSGGCFDVPIAFRMPRTKLRHSASDGGISDPRNAFFGFLAGRGAISSGSGNSTRFDPSVPGLLHLLNDQFTWPIADQTTISMTGIDGYDDVFTLDDLVNGNTAGNPIMFYRSGSRAGLTSYTATGGRSYTDLLDAGYNSFTAPMWGGFDGFNVHLPDPLYNGGMAASATNKNSAAYYTVKRAIDTVADPEAVETNLITMPGLTHQGLTQHIINVCEERADAMALIDLPDVYLPSHEGQYSTKSTKASRIATTPRQAAASLRDRKINSSYGAAFYPWVQTRDDNTGAAVWLPPSAAMLGVLASSEKKAQLWFAPAGFQRGGLSEGAAGIPVSAVTEKLTSKERDILYEASINPIASFPSSGIVVFGQKTLQESQSALDRINVRRLVIYLKKEISRISTKILFEQNVQTTWNRFIGLVEPFLANVKSNFGISDYKLILDDSTTTPDLIDQNIMYAKIMVKPARAIEYIAIDFVIASTGASFDD